MTPDVGEANRPFLEALAATFKEYLKVRGFGPPCLRCGVPSSIHDLQQRCARHVRSWVETTFEEGLL